MLTTVGKELALKLMYGDSSDTITKFKIGSGDDPITAASTDLETVEFADNTDAHAYSSDTITMTSTCIVNTTDYTGDVSEVGLFSTAGVMILGEVFSNYEKDANTNIKFKLRDRHL